MSRLDDTISNVSYVLDCLMALRDIYNTGSCNDCEQNCEYMPKWGQQVRYNCPHYVRKAQEDQKD